MHPQWPTVQFLHCLLAVAGSLAAVASPPAGFALVLVAALSLYLDLNGRAYLLRRLFFRRASQNVVSPPIEGEPRDRLIICAHYDAPLTGAAYNRWAVRYFERFRAVWPARTSPQAIVFWSIALLLIPLGARLATLEGDWIAALQLPSTLILIVATFMLGEIALSPTSPGGNDNASGVEAALLAGDDLAARPTERLTVHLLLAGAGESTRQGAREFIRTHRDELPRERTWFVDIDSAGVGDPRWVTLEVPALAMRADPLLVELAEALAANAEARMPLELGPATSAALAGGFGYPAISLTAREGDEYVPVGHHTPGDTPESISEHSIATVAELATELARLLDRERSRAAAAGEGAT